VVSASAAAAPPAVLHRAYEVCAQLARTHYENFPVASLLLPRRMRPAVSAVYAFARRADDFADEPGYTDTERLTLLDGWQRRLDAAIVGGGDAASSDDLIFVAVADAIRTHDLPVSLFTDLLSAFRQDVSKKRYASWAEVLDYCSRSANPVGRLVLRIGGYRGEALERSSDALCTALQLTNFWQDFAPDWRNGRLYVPLADCAAFGAREADLDHMMTRAAAGDAGAMPPQWAAVMREMARRTRVLFQDGRAVCDGVSGRLKYELRLTWHGGSRILERIERSQFDVLRRPALTAKDALVLAGRTALWTRA
jgi:hydroxysqualene synthase